MTTLTASVVLWHREVKDAFCGIDVACAKRKSLPVAVCVRHEGRLMTLPLRKEGSPPPRSMGNRLAADHLTCGAFAREAAEYLAEVERHFGVRIAQVAIDAPRRPSLGTRRAAEIAMDRLGISCIGTPSEQRFEEIRQKVQQHISAGGIDSRLPHANQLWMLVGFELFRQLEIRYPCIEVFPNAIVNAIAPGCAHKSTADGFARQLDAFATAAAWDPTELATCSHGSRHDRLDAVMSAWIASLPSEHQIVHGDGGLDSIWSVAPSALFRSLPVTQS